MTPEEREAFLKRWSKGQTIYTPEDEMKWPKWTEPPIEIRPVSYMDWKPRDNDLSEDEHKALKDGMMTRWNDGWDKEDWEDLQDMVAPVAGMIVLGGIVFLIWKFGYLLS